VHQALAARRALLMGLAIPFLAGCPPDLSPKGHLALPSGRLLPVYRADETIIRDGGVEYRCWRVFYETLVPLADGKALADEAFGEILSTIAVKAERHGLEAVVLYPTEVPEVHAQTLVGLPIPYYTWQWHTYAYTVIHKRDNLWHMLGGDRAASVSDTVRAVVAAIDSVERATEVGQRVVQIRRDELGVVVTLAALTAGPFDGTTDVRVNADGQIRAIEPLH
jgi:hypothetical protein